MSGIEFEYAIKKDVRNNPIVREVDEARLRQLWKTAGICGVLLVVVLFSVWQNFELIQHGFALQELQKAYEQEEAVNRQLTLELETLRSPAHIERVATRELGLVAPTSDEAIVIERVTPVAPPAKSVVAAR